MMEWRLVFWLAFIILCVTGAVYCVWASGEVQAFNNPVRHVDFATAEYGDTEDTRKTNDKQ